ncbi:MAG: plasmid replication, integration and excision activator [Streptosporangiales bacterium]|nr:plasmid replication, integration and excision activator [Streptosporangiales bacterium]
MAIDGGFRFPVEFGQAFPHGAFVVGEVMPVRDYDAKGDKQKDDKVTGLPLWEVRCMDADPSVRRGEFKVKVASKVQPVPPDALPGLPFRPVEFTGLTVTPYVDDGSKRLAYSFNATGMQAPTGASKTNGAKAASSSAAGKEASA